MFIFHSIVAVHPPDIALEKIAIADHYFQFLHVTLFTSGHPYGPIWARMDPHGPVYHYMLLLYDLYIVFTLFLYDFRWFYT